MEHEHRLTPKFMVKEWISSNTLVEGGMCIIIQQTTEAIY